MQRTKLDFRIQYFIICIGFCRIQHSSKAFFGLINLQHKQVVRKIFALIATKLQKIRPSAGYLHLILFDAKRFDALCTTLEIQNNSGVATIATW